MEKTKPPASPGPALSEDMADPRIDGTGAELKDFSFRLSPMLVKELRQGLRSRIFLIAFILLQIGMVFFTLFASSGNPKTLTVWFWMLLGLSLLFLIPMRASESLSQERTSGTMELLFLTQLSAFRIAWGKWIALFAQGGLLVISVLPYIFLRYYLGGINLLHELFMFFMMVVTMAVVVAAAVGFSAPTHPFIRLLRMLAIVGGGGWLGICAGLLAGEVHEYGILEDIPFSLWWLVLAGLVYGSYFVYSFLDIGASTIAPTGVNHSTRKRLAGRAVLAVTFLLAIPQEEGLWVTGLVIGLFILIPLVVEALNEYPTLTRGIARPFIKNRKRAPGVLRLSAHFFAPGWHTGLLFFGVVTAIATGYLFLCPFTPTSYFDFAEDLLYPFVIGISALLFPVLIIRLFFRKTTALFLHYFVIMGVQFLAFLLLTFLDEANVMSDSAIATLGGFVPLAGLFYGCGWGETPSALIGAFIMLIAALAVIGISSIRLHGRMNMLFSKLIGREETAEAEEHDHLESA